MNKILSSIILLSFLVTNPNFAQKQLPKKNATTTTHHTKFNINNISTYIYNNGLMDTKPDGNSGLEFPKGSDKYAVYESGLVWGGEINNKKYVGGSTYGSGLLPGRILEDGTPQDPNDPSVRVYRVKYNYPLFAEIYNEEDNSDEIRSQYEKDWNEWPAIYGAPFNDLNNDGIYDPEIDIPGVPGAHQTLWYVANDFDKETCNFLYGSDPMNVELQVTIWGYNSSAQIYNDVMFKKYKLINKSENNITDMYFSQWADVDLGDAGDDLIGCDSTLSLMYSYNGDDYDATYLSHTPTVAFQILQGPIVPGETNDKAHFDEKTKTGYKNLEATSNYFFIGSDPVYTDPDLGDYIYGTLPFYNLFYGLVSITGSPFKNPVNDETTKWLLSGDPITKTGWIDGMLHPPGDRRQGLVTGPFEMAVGDTQEIVIAEFAAFGKDRLDGINVVKDYAEIMKDNYPNLITNPNIPYLSNVVPEIKQKESINDDIFEISLVSNETIENFSELGYTFQGYNIYQLPDNNYAEQKYKRIFTYDIVDDVTSIYDSVYNYNTGEVTFELIVEGKDSGIPKNFIIDKDYIIDDNLYKGRTYHYGISSYFYNKNAASKNKVIESRLGQLDLTFKEDIPGIKYLDQIDNQHPNGTADITPLIEVIDPYQLTGDTYEIRFAEQHYYLNEAGNWIKTNYPDSVGKSLGKDVSPSKLNGAAVYSDKAGSIDLIFTLDLISPTNGWVDGIKLTLPDNIQINSIQEPKSNYNNKSIPFVQTGNEIFWGNKDVTGEGYFSGGEMLTVNVEAFTPPTNYSYVIYDDGYGSGEPANPINAEGEGTITEIGYEFKTENYWVLYNKTKDETALEYETILSGKDINTDEDTPLGYEPIIDGFRVKLEGSFESPQSFYSIVINDDIYINREVGERISSYGYWITDYSYFGTVPATSKRKNGYGTENIDKLQQDYEFRFTGIRGSITINGTKVYITKEGTGSIATFYGARQYDPTLHPLNTTGANRFTVRVPFEVWNKDLGIQVNYQIYDRDQVDPAQDGFYVWNENGRMYCEVLNTPYSEEVITEEMTTTLSDDFTWNHIWYASYYSTDYVVEINYANPIQFTDVITFTTPEPPAKNVIPENFSLFQNYPNPFNPNTTIRYYLKEDGKVKISVFNILGQKVKDLVNGNMKAGRYETEFNASSFSSGVYIYRIETNNFIESKKMVFLK